MLKKIISITNVGRLRTCKPHGDVEFRKVTLIYADNASGKTTLCDVFRSLATGDSDYVIGRKSLGVLTAPKVEIRADSGTRTFTSGSWNNTMPELVVFDERYVVDNVFAGSAIMHDQRKGIYRVIVGAHGVSLARKIEQLDEEIRSLTRDLIPTAERSLTAHNPERLQTDSFLELPKIDGIDAAIEIARKAAELEAGVELLSRQPVPSALSLAEFPFSPLIQTLASSLTGLAEKTEERLRAHMETHHRHADEPWLQRGLQLATEAETCPFCGQSLAASEIVSVFRGYFSEEYANLRRQLDASRAAIEAFPSEIHLDRLRRQLEDNIKAFKYWAAIVPMDFPVFDLEGYIGSAQLLRSECLRLVSAKTSDILAKLTPDSAWRAAEEKLRAFSVAGTNYNEAVARAMQVIERKRLAVITSASTGAAKAELARLRAVKARHSTESRLACLKFLELQVRKATADAEKSQLRLELDAYTQHVFKERQADINKLLKRFGTRFRLTNTRRQYVGGTPSAEFQLLIEGTPVDVGGVDTPTSRPSFRNTLSAGDKSALALALFLVQLQRDPDLSQKIVVLDDPFSSQDSNRRGFTIQKIATLAAAAKQVIVLSHDHYFVREMLNAIGTTDRNVLQITHFGDSSLIQPFDVVRACEPQGVRDHQLLLAFVESGRGSAETVRQRLRPFVEEHLYVKFPDQFAENRTLGKMIEDIGSAQTGSPLFAVRPLLADLTAINELSLGTQHRSRLPAAEPRADDEIRVLAGLALEMVRGSPVIE